MNTAILSTIFFIVGTIEYFIDQWERLVSVRLKIFQTLLVSTLNQYVDGVMFFSLLYIMDEFIASWHHGVHDYGKLIAMIFYFHGRIAGTVLAPMIYALKKKRADREKVSKIVSAVNTRKAKKKRVKKQKKIDAIIENHTSDTLLDPVEVADIKSEVKERAIEKASASIAKKIDDALNENN